MDYTSPSPLPQSPGIANYFNKALHVLFSHAGRKKQQLQKSKLQFFLMLPCMLIEPMLSSTFGYSFNITAKG